MTVERNSADPVSVTGDDVHDGRSRGRKGRRAGACCSASRAHSIAFRNSFSPSRGPAVARADEVADRAGREDQVEALGAAVVVRDRDAAVAAVLDRDAREVRPDVLLEPAVVAVRGERGHRRRQPREERMRAVEAGQRDRAVAIAVAADRDLGRADAAPATAGRR